MSMSNRFEDAMYQVIDQFDGKNDFSEFATSCNGLKVSDADVNAAMEDSKDDFKYMMREVILKWKQNQNRSESPCLAERLTELEKKWKRHRKEELGCKFMSAFLVVIILIISWACKDYGHKGNEDICQDKDQAVLDLLQKMNSATEKIVSKHALEELGNPNYDIFPDTVLLNFYNTPVKMETYRPEHRFKQQSSKISGNIIKMSDFFNKTYEQDTRYVALVGGVGYGKTEMLKRIAVDVFRKQHPALKGIKFIKFISLLDLSSNKTFTTAELLFHGVKNVNHDVAECALRYIYANQKKFLLILDGIDQFEGKLDDNEQISNLKAEGKIQDLLSSLCAGHLMNDIKVLVSSREYAIRTFKNKMRPDKVIALSGFSFTAVQKIVNQLGGQKRNLIWNRLNKTTLLSLSSVPMYLVFTLTVLESNEVIPKTSSELLMHILHHHVTSEHVTGNIIPLISSLKPMAFKGLSDSVGTFTVDDLPKGVSIKEVKDLLVTYPAVKLQNKRLFDGHFKLHFCHQSILEALVSLYVAEMPLSTFKRFINHEIHQPQWVIVRRIVCGLLLNSDTYKVAIGNDPTVGLLNSTEVQGNQLSMKRYILRESLKKQLIGLQGDGKNMAALLELMHSLQESGPDVEDIIRSSMEEINLLKLPLAKNDVHVLLSVIQYSNKLTFLSLAGCRIDADDIFNLAATLKKHGVTITIMLLGNYEQELGKREVKAILELQQHIVDSLWLAYRINSEAHDDMKEIMQEYGRPEKIYSWWSGNGSMVIMDRYH